LSALPQAIQPTTSQTQKKTISPGVYSKTQLWSVSRACPNSEKLYISHTEVTDAGLEHLKGLRQLQTLDLSFAKVKGLLDPTERESHGPQCVGLDADPVDGYAVPLGLGQQPEGGVLTASDHHAWRGSLAGREGGS